MATSVEDVCLELTEADIPGASLDEPLDSHTIPALRWWLLCHGVTVPVSLKKPKLIERFVNVCLLTNWCLFHVVYKNKEI